MTDRLTEAEVKKEWQYHFYENLGRICPEGTPTQADISAARAEADRATEGL